MYVLPSPSSLSTWHGVIFVRKGFYRKAIFPFTITIPPTYPELPPAILFPTLPFHPLVSPSGHLTLHPSCSPWSPSSHLLVHCVAHVKKAFYHTDWWSDPTPRTSPSSLFRLDKADFLRRVDRCVAASLDSVYDAGHHLRLSRPRPVHDAVWARVQQRWREEEEGLEVGPYLDWFGPGIDALLDEEAVEVGRGKVAVTAEEEREWMEEELKRRAEERKLRVAAVVAAQEGPMAAEGVSAADGGEAEKGEVEAEDATQADPPLHVLDEEAVLP